MNEAKSLMELAKELVGKTIDEGCNADGKHPRNPFVWAAFNEALCYVFLEGFDYDEVAQRIRLAWDMPELLVAGLLDEAQAQIDEFGADDL